MRRHAPAARPLRKRTAVIMTGFGQPDSSEISRLSDHDDRHCCYDENSSRRSLLSRRSRAAVGACFWRVAFGSHLSMRLGCGPGTQTPHAEVRPRGLMGEPRSTHPRDAVLILRLRKAAPRLRRARRGRLRPSVRRCRARRARGRIRLARLHDGDQVGERLAALAHRAEVALGHDAAHVLGRRCLQPDDVGLVAQAGRNYPRRRRCRRRSRSPRSLRRRPSSSALALVAAEGALAIDLEQRRHGAPWSRSISLSISMNGAVEPLRERAAERRLAGAAQADQRDAPAARAVGDRRRRCRGRRSDSWSSASHRDAAQLRERAPPRRWRSTAGNRSNRVEAEPARDRVEHEHARVALAALDLREIALGRSGLAASILRVMPRLARSLRR